MCKLRFFCVGPQRTATSWLYHNLSSHPDIEFSRKVKETMFFDQRYEKGIQWYDSHFDAETDRTYIGEIAPTYFASSQSAERIASQYGLENVRILILVRNPVDRCHSLFRHHLSKGRVPNDFEKAVRLMPSIIDSGHYRQHSKVWETVFGEPNVQYLLQETIETDPQDQLDKLCQFLHIESVPGTDLISERLNSAGPPKNRLAAYVLSSTATTLRSIRMHRFIEIGKRLGLKSFFVSEKKSPAPMTDECRQFLIDTYTDDICWLEDRLGLNLHGWKMQNQGHG